MEGVYRATAEARLHVVWNDDPSKLWEADWIDELFRMAYLWPVVHVATASSMECYSPRMVIVMSQTSRHWPKLSAAVKNGNCSFGLISLSDEGLEDKPDSYQHPNLRFVFRNYHHPGLHMANLATEVKTFGLGYKTGFWKNFTGKAPRLRTTAERYYVWSFAGTQHHAERHQVLAMFHNLQPSKVVKTSRFGANDGLDVSAYRDLLLDSIFVLCPFGQVNLDTFRLYEALEAGAIPVTLSTNALLQSRYNVDGNYWPMVFSDIPRPRSRSRQRPQLPFIAAESWDSAFATVKRLLDNRAELEQLRRRVYAYWHSYKLATAMHLATKVSEMVPT